MISLEQLRTSIRDRTQSDHLKLALDNCQFSWAEAERGGERFAILKIVSTNQFMRKSLIEATHIQNPFPSVGIDRYLIDSEGDVDFFQWEKGMMENVPGAYYKDGVYQLPDYNMEDIDPTFYPSREEIDAHNASKEN